MFHEGNAALQAVKLASSQPVALPFRQRGSSFLSFWKFAWPGRPHHGTGWQACVSFWPRRAIASLLLLAVTVLGALSTARADSVVVFNEVMYEPALGGEWIELQNQMGVDVDLSGWRLANAVTYTFPQGTVLRAGGFLVVAETPGSLPGLEGVLGPWSGRLNNSGETLELRNNSDRLMDEVEYNDRREWPAAPAGGGPSLARRAKFVDGSRAESWASSRQRGGTPGAENFPEPPATPAGPPLVLNEVGMDWIELMNVGDAPANAAGCRVSVLGSPDLILEEQIIVPGGWAVIPFTPPPAAQAVLLFAPDGETLLDAARLEERTRARFPDGNGRWLYATSDTPGAANHVTLREEIVINEIMFDPPDPALLASDAPQPGQWIELHNKTAAAVDLGGWWMEGGITYMFPEGAALPAGGYIVLAQNPTAFATGHTLPPESVFGPWTRTLSRGQDTLLLLDPHGNPADEVTYYAEGRWPVAANAGGSSMELRDPAADNTIPEAWAASDESGKAAWQTFTWRGPNRPSQTGEPTLWRELNMLLVDGPGECLIDDVKVIDTVTGDDLIQNGDFENEAAHWRLLGTHRHSRVEPEPGHESNHVLRLVATGPGEYQGNQIESTFLDNRALVQNREYEISLRARWLSGGGRLNTRLYFNRLPRTNLLHVVPNGGTPGAPNSRIVANLGPVYRVLVHSPIVPAANQAVTVSVEAADPQGIAALQLHYSAQGGAWQTVPMTAASGNRYTGTIPGRASGAVQFYVEGTDTAGAASFFPAAGPASRALYQVQDGRATGTMPKVRVVMPPADATFLHQPVNTLSNEYISCTVIADERDVYYNAGIRLKGSFVGRNVARVGFTLRFDSDRLFRGIHDKIAIDRSQHTALAQGEIILKHIASAAGGIPNMYDDLARFIHPNASHTGSSQLRLTAFENEFLDTQYPSGGDGEMFEVEVLRWNLQTMDGNPESPKRPGNEGGGTGYLNLEVQDYGGDKEAYRWMMLQTKSRDRDEYSRVIALSKLFSKTGAAFAAEAPLLLDQESWLRTLAFQSLVGPADSIYTGSNHHNFRLYFRPDDGRALFMPWDWDSAYQRATNASIYGSGNFLKVITSRPESRRRYLWHLHNLIQTTFNTAYMTRWTQHYGAVAGENFSSILSYISSRANFVRTQLPIATAFTATATRALPDGPVVISGSGNIAVQGIEVNGTRYEPVWSSNTAWSVSVPVPASVRDFTIRGLDHHGLPVEGAAATASVEIIAPPDLTRGLLAHYSFDETSGLTAADAAGGDHLGTLLNFSANNSHWQPGHLGGALSFNAAGAAAGQVVEIAASSSLDFAASKTFTLAGWVKALPAVSQISGAGLICKGYGGGGEQYCVDIHNGTYRFYVWNGGSPNTPTVVSTALGPTGGWQHVAAVFDQGEGLMKMYVDGEEAGSAGPPATLRASAAPVSLGARTPDQNATAYSLAFQGWLDDVRIYGRALPSEEIALLYQLEPAPAGPPPELRVARQGDTVELSWPADVTGWVLEESAALNGWTETPGVADNKLTVPAPVGVKFYRLRRP